MAQGPSLQEQYAPRSVCFGCGPANERGLRIKSRVEGDRLVCVWNPEEHYHAFQNILNGGIIGTLMDCHSNWTAVYAMMRRDGSDRPPPTVTSEYSVRFLRPTPMDQKIRMTSNVVDLLRTKAVVECRMEVGDITTATLRGTFVVVSKEHPAHSRWL